MAKHRVIAACTNAKGAPDFAIVHVNCTPKEIESGSHYDKAREQLGDDDFEAEMVLFDESDCLHLPWFVEGVKRYLGVK